MVSAVVSLLGLAFADFDRPGILVPVLLAGLGFALGVGPLASSIAIRERAPEETAGTVGAIESTGYEIGGGLGVATFGLLVNSIYRKSFAMPDGAPGSSANSIGEAMIAAQTLTGDLGIQITSAAKLAFVDAHGAVLVSVAVAISLLAGVILLFLPRADCMTGRSWCRPYFSREDF